MTGTGTETGSRALTELDPAFYREVFYRIENPALIIDPGFVIRDANGAAAEFLRCGDRDRLVGTPVTEILVDDDVLGEVAERVAADDRWAGEAKLRTFDDRVYFGTGSAVPIEAADGEQYIVGLFTDLTRRRRYMHSLKVLNRILRHNIRNEVNVILGHLELLRSEVGADGHERIDALYDIMDDLLDRADTARELETLIRQTDPDVLSSVRLDTPLRRALETAKVEYDATFDTPPSFEPVEVIADDTVRRVLDEVIENAVEHNDADRPRVRVSTTVSDGSVVVRVADNGPGVPPADRDRVLGREEIDQLHHGEGFGLFFVDQAMKTYGGDVRIGDSELGGATFELRFPRVE